MSGLPAGAAAKAGKKKKQQQKRKAETSRPPSPVPAAVPAARAVNKRPKRRHSYAEARYFKDPVYGDNAGTSAEVWLGPAAGLLVNYGSKPVAGECKAAEKLNDELYMGSAWIKGHLQNDNLGGPGKSYNLTPMTSDANKTFEKNFENLIKKAIDCCHAFYNDDIYATTQYGVHVKVQVVGRGRNDIPDPNAATHKAIGTTVTCTSNWIAVDVSGKKPWRIEDVRTEDLPDGLKRRLEAVRSFPSDYAIDPTYRSPAAAATLFVAPSRQAARRKKSSKNSLSK